MDFEGDRILQYDNGASFIPRCEICNRFVKADETIKGNDHGIADEPNATCKKHGRIKMIFVGYL